MAGTFPAMAQTVDKNDFSEPFQSLSWTDAILALLSRASQEQNINSAPIDTVRALVRSQIELGHGADDFNRIVENFRRPRE